MKNCTFQPSINISIPDSFNKVVIVWGLDRHLEIKEMQARKEYEQKKREEEVFGHGKNYGS